MERQKKEDIKELAVKFFYWWYNASGTNTEQGFDKWWGIEGEELFKEKFDYLESKEEWISVEDRLPEEGEQVVIYVEGKEKSYIAESEYSGEYFCFPYYGQDMTGAFENVTYWMSPKPPIKK